MLHFKFIKHKYWCLRCLFPDVRPCIVFLFLPANCECFSVPLELVFGVNFASVRIIRFPSFSFPLVHLSPVTMRNELRDTQVCHTGFWKLLILLMLLLTIWFYFTRKCFGFCRKFLLFSLLVWNSYYVQVFCIICFQNTCDSLLSFKSQI